MSKKLKWRAPKLAPVVLFKKKAAFTNCIGGSGDAIGCNIGSVAAICYTGNAAAGPGGCTNGPSAGGWCGDGTGVV